MPAYYDEKTKTWFCKFYYTDHTGAKKQKKKRGFSLKREAQEWERTFLEKQQGTPANIRAKTALELLFYSGMRLGEMLALTLGDLDFTDNTISITKTYVRKSKAPGPPKTDNGIRCISMPATVMQNIQTYTSKIYGIEPSDRLFTFSENLIRRNVRRGAEVSFPVFHIHRIMSAGLVFCKVQIHGYYPV